MKVARQTQPAELSNENPRKKAQITGDAAAKLVAQAAALPSTEQALELGPSRAELARNQLSKTAPKKSSEAIAAAKRFLAARREQEHGPPLNEVEETWWLQLLNAVRGYNSLANFDEREKCFKDKRKLRGVSELLAVMEDVRDLDEASRKQQRARLPNSAVFNFPSRMDTVIDVARRSLEKRERPPKPPAHRILTPQEMDQFLGFGPFPYVGDVGSGTQFRAPVSPGIDNVFEQRPDGTMVAVPSRKGIHW